MSEDPYYSDAEKQHDQLMQYDRDYARKHGGGNNRGNNNGCMISGLIMISSIIYLLLQSL